jgi:uncharacterized Zn finger protein (UPF0148 family)
MAKKTRQGQKQCPKCKTWVRGTRTKACPKCNHQFNGKQKKAPTRKPVAAAVEKPTNAVIVEQVKAANTVTFEQVKAVTQTVQVVGGIPRLNELLGLVKEIGGVKKFKDLLDAMSAPKDDVIPF